MKKIFYTLLSAAMLLGVSSCVSKKQYNNMQADLAAKLDAVHMKYVACEQNTKQLNSTLQIRKEQIADLKDQLNDCKSQRDKQIVQVGDLTVLSQSANQNINKTLEQLAQKDKYIQVLQAARTKADSINLALAVNLKGVLKDGLDDQDVEVRVDKTVVFINLSDKMLYQSGSAQLTPRAKEVLGKIASILQTKPDMEVMVEGYTDTDPIKNQCIKDNWDLSVIRATAVVRVLQEDYKIDPNRLIAAGRGEYNALASNDTPQGKEMNRRTRIIIMPKLDQFYDLLNPEHENGDALK